jgi:1-acyl-sn-glycerol-3-phosphate acyltransferase
MWLPRSTCDAGCLPRPGEVARVPTGVVLWRLCAVVAVVLVGAVVLPLLPAGRVPLTLQRTARAVLAALGVRHAMRGRVPQRRALIVANHVSWLDVLVLLAYAPCRLIAKHEVRDWPVIGRLAVAAGAVFIDRSRPRSLPGTVAAAAAALRADGVVARRHAVRLGNARGRGPWPDDHRTGVLAALPDRCVVAQGARGGR